MIEFRGVHKAFDQPGGDRAYALRGIDLRIEEGEFVTVLGSNGSGKSTLLNVLAGSANPDQGHVLIDAQDVSRRPEHRRALYIGRVFQNPFQGTSPSLSVAENLRLASLRGCPRGFRTAVTQGERARFGELLAHFELGLENRLDALVESLSGGQRQALTLLMATLRRPKILLLDEHTAALDPRAADRILHLTELVVREQSLTVLMVTHELADALRIGNRTVMIHRGRIVLDARGDERSALSVDALRERFERLYREELDSRDRVG
ncbi:MAG: ATP-binding cassette domain-containing protein [Fimbriimonadaceae bacterium]|nr:ATP-binding cassette domain-containing protein [Fimbriimonadaceae bacterium]